MPADVNVTNREDLTKVIEDLCNDIVATFKRKNKSYGNTDDAFYNFRETARRIWGKTDADSMIGALLVYMDKHWVALTQNGIETPEVEERFTDMAVYSLIALAIIKLEGGLT